MGMVREKTVTTKAAKAKAAADILAQVGSQPVPVDDETRKMRLKTLIKLGKERGFLTYAEINDHLPDDVVDAEQIESIISTAGLASTADGRYSLGDRSRSGV
jgi:RNA polymerase primary sigma factor